MHNAFDGAYKEKGMRQGYRGLYCECLLKHNKESHNLVPIKLGNAL